MKISSMLAGAMLLAGCTTVPEMTRDQYLAMSTHHFGGRSKEEVIRAAETVLRQPGNSRLTIADNQTGFVAYRPYFIYAVIAAEYGVDTWQFSTTDSPGGVDASLTVTRARGASGATAAPVIGGSGIALSSTSSSAPAMAVRSPYTYRLFWDRLDYVLGAPSGWPRCADRSKTQGPGDEAGPSVYGLCSTTGNDMPAPPVAASTLATPAPETK